jgi:hypothetical protein
VFQQHILQIVPVEKLDCSSNCHVIAPFGKPISLSMYLSAAGRFFIRLSPVPVSGKAPGRTPHFVSAFALWHDDALPRWWVVTRMQDCGKQLERTVMSARKLAAALLQYLDARACSDFGQLEHAGVVRDVVELKQRRDEILVQLHSSPQLTDEPMFVSAREYLLDEASCDATHPHEREAASVQRLEALRTHLRKEARTFLAVGGFRKPERVTVGLPRRLAKTPPKTVNGARILMPVDGSQYNSQNGRAAAAKRLGKH